ncbi:MAG: AMP-binding protein [Chloroflexi bacterium]|nr:AMP-binding protein [Chloroflexota bacterium]
MERKTHREIVKGWYPFSREEIKQYVSRGIWRNLTFGDILDRNVANIPDKPAVIDDTRSVTWLELAQKADRLALHFKRLGLEYGDFVVMITPNVVEFYFLLFGLARIGVIPVMGLPRHRRKEVSYLASLHEAKAIVVPVGEKFDYVGMVREFRSDTPILKHFCTLGGPPVGGWTSIEKLLEERIEENYPKDHLAQFKPDPNDIVVEQLSGGTTGLPKGIPRTHNDYIYIWDYVGRREGNTDESVCLCIPPVAHNMPISDIAGPMFLRGGVTVITKSTRPEDHFRIIEKHRVTNVDLVPVLISYWMEAGEVMKKYDLSSLKIVACGAQKAKPEIVRWCIEKLGVSFCNTFGMTEGPVIATRWDSPKEAQLNTVGRPILTDELVTIKLVDNDNGEVPPGAVGELVVRGPMMTFKGYFRNPEETAKSFDEQGFFHTGDLMSVRPDGRYVVEGRKKDMIIRGGENVYPEPVEGWLMKHPRVANAAVVGMPDAKLGEKLCAFIQATGGQTITFAEVQQFMKEQGVAVYQWPERLEVAQGWPLTPVNKIDKRLLRGFVTYRLLEEGLIDVALGDEFLAKDKLTVDDIRTGKVKIDFTGSPG